MNEVGHSQMFETSETPETLSNFLASSRTQNPFCEHYDRVDVSPRSRIRVPIERRARVEGRTSDRWNVDRFPASSSPPKHTFGITAPVVERGGFAASRPRIGRV